MTVTSNEYKHIYISDLILVNNLIGYYYLDWFTVNKQSCGV